jgi:putative tryptophan/tyrosine transport system substrate-binding protein
MKRREFIALLGGVAAWPLAARAQQPDRLRRIGVLLGGLTERDPEGQARVSALRNALAKLGWIPGRTLQIEYRWTGDNPARVQSYAAELVALTPDVLVAIGTPATVALKNATRTIPVVFVQPSESLLLSLVTSLAHPGGNLTGFGTRVVSTKRLELLKEIAPRVTNVAYLYDPANPSWSAEYAALGAAAPSLEVKLSALPVRDGPEIERGFATIAREPNSGVITLASPAVNLYRDLIVGLAAQHRLPSVHGYRYYVAAGALASYGFDNIDLYGRAAAYVDRILRGEKPADLPVQLPDKFELVINLKTAKALGLTVSDTLLALADEVIE